MPLSKKEIREITGFTFKVQRDDPKLWFERACSFHEAAILLNDNLDDHQFVAYYYNAGLSIELALKAIILSKSKTFETNHKLVALSQTAGVVLTKNQQCTLELLSEMILWSSRYPAPKNEGQWDNYHDVVFEKHIIRENEGNNYRTLAHQGRIPSIENYKTIWKICTVEYKKTA